MPIIIYNVISQTEMNAMKVTKEKAEENRQQVIETSSRLFREKGFDGVGVSTPMAAFTSSLNPRTTSSQRPRKRRWIRRPNACRP
jgi:hypothetical protein